MGNIHAVLINVGSPKSPSRHNVKRFLRSYLMDRHVIRMPWILRVILVRGIIIPFRLGDSVKRYRKIWSKNGSPIVYKTESLITKIDEKLTSKSCDATVSYAMRHGDNSIEKEFKLLSKFGVEDILVIPQYPQYEKSSYLSTVDESRRVAKRLGLNVRFTPPFFNHGDYISSLERSMREALTNNPVDKIIYSFHSIPLKYLPCGAKVAAECDMTSEHDYCEGCYKHQCYATSRLVSANIGIEEEDYRVVFQSRLSVMKWLSPTLNTTLSELPKEGVSSVAVIAPSFTVDCIETLEEIDVCGRAIFEKSGGKEFRYIAALNDLDLWSKKLSKWIMEADAAINNIND